LSKKWETLFYLDKIEEKEKRRGEGKEGEGRISED
jgi:hypothetical protein